VIDPYTLPGDLPVPDDDGASDHLVGAAIPELVLESSEGAVDLCELAHERLVLYVYPATGRPGEPMPAGWDEIPGARGCTPQSCGFRDHAAELAALGARVAGLSAQPLEDQIEFAERNRMPFPVVADPELRLGAALGLPTFEVEGRTLYKRLALVAERGEIVKVFYPVFPPDRNADDVLAWLEAQPLVLSTQEGYDRWAEIYDGDGNPLTALEEPEVDQLVGDVAGLDVADVGCGTGRHALRLAARGANVTAIDFSDGMLARAREKDGAERVRWLVHDLTSLPLPLPDCAFDRVVCALVAEHIADLPAFFAELRRICRPDGRIVVTDMHPALMLKGVQARFHDPVTGRDTRPASEPHLVSDYVNGAGEAGLKLVRIGERTVDERLAASVPRAQKYLGWPLLLWLELEP
jgi:peroxiredoxin